MEINRLTSLLADVKGVSPKAEYSPAQSDAAKKKGIKKGYVGDDSDEDEKDDREYSWKIYRK